MFKKILFFAILIIFLLTTFTFADDIDELPEDENLIEEVSTEVSEEPKVYSRSAIVFDRNTKSILYEKDINTKRAMASTTKIMTCIIILENGNLNETVKISQKSANTGGSRLGLKKNDSITVKDLLYGLMLRSGNDAAVALAEYMSGSIEEFANLMNEKAKTLGLTNTHFVTPHGLDDENHYTTAYELALLTDYALNNSTFSKIVNTKNYTITINGYSKALNNTNELLGYLNGVNGVKTGFTGNAGRCLVTSCVRNNFNIITIVLGADTKKIRTTDSIHLIEYAYNNFEQKNVKTLIEKEFKTWLDSNLNKIIVNKSYNSLNLNLSNSEKENLIVIKKSEINDISIDIHSISYLEAPVYKDTKIGVLEVKSNEKTLLSIDIIASNDVYKKDCLDYLKIFLVNFNNYFKINV